MLLSIDFEEVEENSLWFVNIRNTEIVRVLEIIKIYKHVIYVRDKYSNNEEFLYRHNIIFAGKYE